MTKPILVIGKNSQLGRTLQKTLQNLSDTFKIKPYINKHGEKLNKSDLNFIFVARKELDLLNIESINGFFQNDKFEAIINFAAYTSVDEAEINIELAEQINHIAVAKLAKISKNQDIPLIHISTDYVFGGKAYKPYEEKDATEPLNIYGLTKYKGEKVIAESGCNGAIIRTSWLYSEFGNNFVKTMLDLGKERESINVVDDQVGSPTYAKNLANLLLTMLHRDRTVEALNSQLSIYHFSDEGSCSWYDFAKSIFKLRNINCEIKPVKTVDFPSRAKRPQNNVLSKAKIKKFIPDLVIPRWQDSLINCLTEIQK